MVVVLPKTYQTVEGGDSLAPTSENIILFLQALYFGQVLLIGPLYYCEWAMYNSVFVGNFLSLGDESLVLCN